MSLSEYKDLLCRYNLQTWRPGCSAWTLEQTFYPRLYRYIHDARARQFQARIRLEDESLDAFIYVVRNFMLVEATNDRFLKFKRIKNKSTTRYSVPYMLGFAIVTQNVALCRRLVSCADTSALELACSWMCGCPEIVRVLSMVAIPSDSCLKSACRYGFVEIVRFLLQEGQIPDVRAGHMYGLQWALLNRHEEVVAVLGEFGITSSGASDHLLCIDWSTGVQDKQLRLRKGIMCC